MKTRARAALASRRSRLLAAALSLALAACGTLSPQVYSDRLDPPRLAPDGGRAAQPATPPASGASARVPVDVALHEAEAMQRKYVQAVRSLSEAGTGSSAALIGLSALGLFKAVTDPDSRDLAGLGVLGGATYAYSTTMTSRARQRLYLAGAEALNCAISATRPYVLPPGWLRDPAHAATGSTLEDQADQAYALLRGIDDALARLRPFNEARREVRVVGSAPAPGCARVVPPGRCDRPADGNGDRMRLYETCVANREAYRRACAGRVRQEVELSPHPDVPLAIDRLQRLRGQLGELAHTARQQAVVFASAGDRLHDRTTAVQLAVGDEVLKTEPDLAKVLAAATALRGTAFSLTGAPAFAPAEAPGAAEDVVPGLTQGQAERAPGRPRPRAAERPDEALDAAHRVAEEAARLADAMRARLATMKAQVAAANQRLEQCGSPAGAATFKVTPGADEIELAPGGSATFVASGGAGTPAGAVAGGADPAIGELTRKLDGAFEFKAAASAPGGSRVVLRFTDGSGTVSRDVAIRIVKPAVR